MPPAQSHDAPPPPNWPQGITYLSKPRLSSTFPSVLIPFLCDTKSPKFTPHPIQHPAANLSIKPITLPTHPAYGQYGLFTRSKIPGKTMIITYLGIIHHTLTPTDETISTANHEKQMIEAEESDYDLSLLRVSGHADNNPFPGYHISIGVDAAKCGNAARFVNDYRGVSGCANAEFRVGRGEGGEMRMEVWSLGSGVGKGEEVLVSYGKGWWAGRKG